MIIKQVKPYLIPTLKTEDILTPFHKNISVKNSKKKSSKLKTFTLKEKEKNSFLSHLKIGLSVPEAIIVCKLPIKEMQDFINENVDGIQFEIAQAMIQKKVIHLNRITKGEKNWQASAFYLERRYKEEFGKEVKVNSETTTRQVMDIGGKEIEF